MRKSALFGFGGLLIASAASAEFQTEVNFALVDLDVEGDNQDGFLIQGIYHFDKVDTSKGPLELASFLDQAASVTGIFADFGDNDGISLSTRFFVNDGVTVEAGFDEDISAFNIGVGKYLTADSEVSLTFADAGDVDSRSLTLDYFAVKDADGSTSYAYGAEISVIDGDGDTGFGIGGNVTYYFNPAFGVGISASLVDVGAFEQDNISIDANYFFAENIAVFGAIARDIVSTGNFSGDIDTLLIGVTGRF